MSATSMYAPGGLSISHSSLGAQILQAKLGSGLAVFYLSPLGVAEGPAVPARGGIPVLFPQFAERGPLAKHGFARTTPWQLVEETVSIERHRLRYALDVAAHQFAHWPHAARLELSANATPDCLALNLGVTNVGTGTFGWTGGLHPYLAVQDLLSATVTGLAGVPVQDRYDGQLRQQPAGPLGWGEQPFERLYNSCPPLVLTSGLAQLELTASGFDQWMVWNPGKQGAAAMADLPPHDWRRFVCLEPVCVERPVMLAPGMTFVGRLNIRALQDNGTGR